MMAWVPRNPLPVTGIGDPFILKDAERYYLYATSKPDGFLVWQSRDLYTWSEPAVCYQATQNSFGSGSFWAPEVYCFDGRYYMYYTAQWKRYQDEALRLGVAVANSPLGPFIDATGDQPMFDPGYGVLDGHVFTDDGGQRYLYYSCAGHDHIVNGAHEADIYGIWLGKDLLSVEGEPQLLIQTDQAWERQGNAKQFWNEGPFMLKHEGRYHLMYSANYFGSRWYGVGAAVGASPMGPFSKYSNNPILRYWKARYPGPVITA